MSLSRHTSRIYIDEYDLDGVLNVLSKRVAGNEGLPATPYTLGAYAALNLIRNHDEIRDQSVFIELFDRIMEDGGVEPLRIKED